MAEDFTYIVARLRAIEAALPDRSWFERLVRSPQENVLGSLREYYPAFESIDSLYDFERALMVEKKTMLHLVVSLLAEERSRLFIAAGYDFDNVRHAWKAAKRGRSASALVSYGLVDPEIIVDAVAGKLASALPEHLKELIEALEREFETSASLSVAEYAAEKLKWKFLSENAPDSSASQYVRSRIDLMNIKNLLRLRMEPIRKLSLDKIWCDGGEIEAARFSVFIKASIVEFFAFLATSSYRSLLGLGLSPEEPQWKIDAAMRRFIMDTLSESKYRHFDFSPVLYHIELHERNEEMIRRIALAKLGGLPETTILSRLENLVAA